MPLPALAAAGIQVGAAGGSMGLSSLFNRDAEKRQQNYNTRVYERTRNDNIADWHMQNQYNSPQEVMRRYKEAGLNPNLIYGNGTTASAQAVKSAETGSFQAIPNKIDPTQIGDSVNTYFNVLKQKAEISNLEETNKQIQANTNYINYKAITEGFMPEYLRKKTDNVEAGTQNTVARTHYTQLQDSQLSDLYPIMKRIRQNQALNLMASTAKMEAETKTTNAMREPVLNKLDSETYKIKMDALLKEYQQATESQKREKIAQEIINLKHKANILEKDDMYYETKGISNFLKGALKR